MPTEAKAQITRGLAGAMRGSRRIRATIKHEELDGRIRQQGPDDGVASAVKEAVVKVGGCLDPLQYLGRDLRDGGA